jgi:hypothetical protein
MPGELVLDVVLNIASVRCDMNDRWFLYAAAGAEVRLRPSLASLPEWLW